MKGDSMNQEKIDSFVPSVEKETETEMSYPANWSKKTDQDSMEKHKKIVNQNKMELKVPTSNDSNTGSSSDSDPLLSASLGTVNISSFVHLSRERDALQCSLESRETSQRRLIYDLMTTKTLEDEGTNDNNVTIEKEKEHEEKKDTKNIIERGEKSKVGSPQIELNTELMDVQKEIMSREIDEIITQIKINEEKMSRIGEELGYQLVETLEENGFLYITGHLICPFLLHQANRYGKGFFRNSDLEEKQKAYSKDRARRGYSDLNSENFASLLGMKGPNDYVEKFRFGPTLNSSSSHTLAGKDFSNNKNNASMSKSSPQKDVSRKDLQQTMEKGKENNGTSKVKADPLLMENIFPHFTLDSYPTTCKENIICPPCCCSIPCPSSTFENVMLKYYEEVHKVSVTLLELLERGIKICLQRYQKYIKDTIDEEEILNFNLTSLLTSVENQHTGIVSVNYYPEVINIDSGKKDERKKEQKEQEEQQLKESTISKQQILTNVNQNNERSKFEENEKRKSTGKLRYRVAPHTDVSLFTLLYQEPIIPCQLKNESTSSSGNFNGHMRSKRYGGLHIQSPLTKEWLAIPPPHLEETSKKQEEEGEDKSEERSNQSEGCGGFIFNVGDCLNYITCGGLPSTIHSVLLPSVGVDDDSLSFSSRNETYDNSKENNVDRINNQISPTIPDRLTLVYFVGPGSNSILPSIPLDEYFRVNSLLRTSNDDINTFNEKQNLNLVRRKVDDTSAVNKEETTDFIQDRFFSKEEELKLTSFPSISPKRMMSYGKWRKERVKIAMKKLRENHHL